MLLRNGSSRQPRDKGARRQSHAATEDEYHKIARTLKLSFPDVTNAAKVILSDPASLELFQDAVEVLSDLESLVDESGWQTKGSVSRNVQERLEWEEKVQACAKLAKVNQKLAAEETELMLKDVFGEYYLPPKSR